MSAANEDVEETAVESRYWPPPAEKTVDLVGSYGSKTVSAFAFNNAGTRFAAGNHDYEVRIWDFSACNPLQPQSIANVQPSGQHVIKSLDFSHNDELILVISGSCQAVLLGKDGLVCKEYECVKGDQYLTDMAQTKGHTQTLNDGNWHPRESQTFATCSNDSTIRLWDITSPSGATGACTQKTVIKARSPTNGLKAQPNVCRFSRDGLSIAAGCADGSILIWDTRRKFISTSACIKNAHLKGNEITGLDFSYTPNRRLCTRSQDETCKLWDLRQLKKPLASRSQLTNVYSTTDCSFSPDDQVVITGSSAEGKEVPGAVHLLKESPGELLSSEQTLQARPGASVVRTSWHPRINHLAYTCSNGDLQLTYSPERSLGGFLTAPTGRSTVAKRKRFGATNPWDAPETVVNVKRIITPHSLPMYREDQTASKRAKGSHGPEMPAVHSSGAASGLSVRPAGSTLSSFIARNIAKPVDDPSGADIRERILRHAGEAERNPRWIQSRPAPAKSESAQAGAGADKTGNGAGSSGSKD